ASDRRAERGRAGAGSAGQCGGPLFRWRSRGAAYRYRVAQGDHFRSCGQRTRSPGNAARRRPHAIPGSGDGLRRARPAWLQPHHECDRAAGCVRCRLWWRAVTQAASPWQVYRRLLRFAQPYRPLLAVAGIGMLLEAAAAAGFTKLMEPIIDETFISKDAASSLWLPLAIVGLFVVRGIAGYVTDINMARAGRSIARDLRVQVLGKYLRLPGLRFDSEPVPSMLVR